MSTDEHAYRPSEETLEVVQRVRLLEKINRKYGLSADQKDELRTLRRRLDADQLRRSNWRRAKH